MSILNLTTARTGILSALSAAMLAGCSLTPDYERPAAPVPESYSTGNATIQGSESTALPVWQDYFTDPLLQQLIHIALEHNRDMQVATHNLEKVRAAYQIERASLFPTLQATASATRSRSPATAGQTVESFSAAVTIPAWELDFFGRVRSLKAQALSQYLATDEARRAWELVLVTSVAQGWLTLMADEELLDISRRTLVTREESSRLAQLRFDAGVASELDLRQAQSLTAAAQATYAQQQRQRVLDENALVLLLGQPLPPQAHAALNGAKLAKATPMADIPPGLPSELLTRRPDIRQAEHNLMAANASIGAARAAFFPSIALTTQFGTTSSELDGLFKSGTWVFGLTPSVNIPIFNAGRNQARLQVAQANRAIALAQYEKAIQSAFREVSDALAGHDTYAAQVRAQTEQVQAERRRLQLAELRYSSGASSYLDLLDAQRSLFALEQADVQVRLMQRINQINLYKALGGGWAAQPLGTTAPTP